MPPGVIKSNKRIKYTKSHASRTRYTLSRQKNKTKYDKSKTRLKRTIQERTTTQSKVYTNDA